MGLSPFLCDGVVEFPRQPPLSFGHLPQMRQVKFGMRIEQLDRRIWGRLGDGLLSTHDKRSRDGMSTRPFCVCDVCAIMPEILEFRFSGENYGYSSNERQGNDHFPC